MPGINHIQGRGIRSPFLLLSSKIILLHKKMYFRDTKISAAYSFPLRQTGNVMRLFVGEAEVEA